MFIFLESHGKIKLEMIEMKKEIKKDLKFILIFVLIIGLSFFYLFQSSYAKYRKQVNGSVDSTIAKWNILVNNEDIGNKKELTNKITPTFIDDGWSKKTTLAPGSTGYYDIVIDPSKVDVFFIYELTSTTTTDSSIPDLITTGYTIGTTGTQTPYVEGTPIKGYAAHNSSPITIRIYIKWEDKTGTMDNQTDTNVAIDQNSKALIKVGIKFSQWKP